MISLVYTLWFLVALFGVIGALRGWAKEVLVIFSVLLALFVITLLEQYAGFFPKLVVDPNLSPDQQLAAKHFAFWIRAIIVSVLAYFGYQTALIKRFIKEGRLARESLQDMLLGLFLGSLNGFLIMGTILSYLHELGYPFPEIINPPTGAAFDIMTRLAPFLPPHWLGQPGIYFAIAIAFIFVLVVFI